MSHPVSVAELVNLAREALRLAPPTFPADLPTSKIAKKPEWYPFEDTCWALGENIRQKLLRSPRLRGNPQLIGAILDVIEQRNLRRGRQSFVMLLGSVKAAYAAPRLALWATDSDIDGHVVDSLLKMRVAGYSQVVEPHLSSEFSWIRRKAETYLRRYPA